MPLLSSRSLYLRASHLDDVGVAGDEEAESEGGGPSTSSSKNDVEEGDQELMSTFSLSQSLRDRNAALVEELRGELILAPLTRGNHAPFRKWCMENGCKATMSEMAFAKTLLK